MTRRKGRPDGLPLAWSAWHAGQRFFPTVLNQPTWQRCCGRGGRGGRSCGRAAFAASALGSHPRSAWLRVTPSLSLVTTACSSYRSQGSQCSQCPPHQGLQGPPHRQFGAERTVEAGEETGGGRCAAAALAGSRHRDASVALGHSRAHRVRWKGGRGEQRKTDRMGQAWTETMQPKTGQGTSVGCAVNVGSFIRSHERHFARSRRPSHSDAPDDSAVCLARKTSSNAVAATRLFTSAAGRQPAPACDAYASAGWVRRGGGGQRKEVTAQACHQGRHWTLCMRRPAGATPVAQGTAASRLAAERGPACHERRPGGAATHP